MGKITGFMEYERKALEGRDVLVRIKDFNEVYRPAGAEQVTRQGARCMDCGIPFCHTGCPLNNIIPDWNDLVYRDRWQEALRELHSTNNFPEFTGRICPAPVRGGLRARHQRGPGGDQDDREDDRRSRLGGRLDRSRASRDTDWQEGRRRRRGPGRAWPRRSSSTAPATPSRSSRRARFPAAYSRWASPTSRWRSITSPAGSIR